MAQLGKLLLCMMIFGFCSLIVAFAVNMYSDNMHVTLGIPIIPFDIAFDISIILVGAVVTGNICYNLISSIMDNSCCCCKDKGKCDAD